MSPETEEQIKAHAVAEFPRESCGLVCVVKGRERYLPCKNIAESREEHFVLDPQDYAAASDAGEIIAIVHSHPNESARPSDADRVQCEAWGVPWHIVPVSAPDDATEPVAGEIYTFAPNGYEAPLVGRKFYHGVLDCYALVRDYFKREHGIEMYDAPREDDWWHKGQSLYLDNLDKMGLIPAQGALREGDVILMQIRSPIPNHAAIYLGDDVILHHLYGRLSSRDVYGGYWREVTTHLLRKEELA